MNDQPALFGDAPARPVLTPRQQHVHDALVEHGRLDTDEAGALAHTIKTRGHPADQRCPYCHSDGRAILEALVKKGLARRRRGGGRIYYQPAHERPQEREPDEIDWGGFGE